MKFLLLLICLILPLAVFGQQVEEQINLKHELKKLGHDSINAKSLMDERVIEVLKKSMNQSHIYEQSHEMIKALIMGNVKGSYGEKVFTRYPKLLDAAAGFVGDKEALPAFLGIFQRKDDLKTYGLVWLVLIIIGVIIKRKFFPKDLSFGSRLILSSCLNLCIAIISFGFFYNMFRAELSPTIRILKYYL